MADFAELCERLKEERARLNGELERLDAEMRPSGDRREGSPFGKREEEATEAFELEKRLAVEKRLAQVLAEVEHALEKYGAGTYGVCDLCGQQIQLARLEALPQASFCLECKGRQTRNARSKSAR